MIKKKIHQTKFKKRKAYSLIELAIVITILSILITGSLVAISKIYSQGKYSETNYKIAEIYKALGAYLVANEKLPCPAPINSIKSSDSSYGVALSDCSNPGASTGVYTSTSGNVIYGMVPVATLGLSKDFAEDGFASKIAYVVNKNFTSSTTFGNASYQNIITIKEANNQTITNDAIFAIISYGFNKYGSLNTNISDIQNSCISSDDNEQENDIYPSLAAGSTSTCLTLSSCPSRCPSLTTTSFDDVLFLSSSSTEDFDDIVFYKTRNDLISDFDALSLIKCPSSSLTITYGVSTTTFTWPESKYNQVAASTPQCPTGYQSGVQYPTRKCGSYGNWETNLGDSNGLINSCVQDTVVVSGSSTCSYNIIGVASPTTVNAGSGQLSCNATGYDSNVKIDYTCSGGIFYKTTPTQTCNACANNYTYSNGVCSSNFCSFTAGLTGTIDSTSVAGLVIYYFTSGTGTINCPSTKTAKVLVVGGGGSGGYGRGGLAGGGGGGGSVVIATSYPIAANNDYSVIVGNGGTAPTSSNTVGASGSNSVFGTISAIGGGGGGNDSQNNRCGLTGGSGGGSSGSGSGGTTCYGYANQPTQSNANYYYVNSGGGLSNVSDSYPAGGGGGAGGGGVSASSGSYQTVASYNNGGAGGAGIGIGGSASTIISQIISGTTYSSYFFGAGGGGGSGYARSFVIALGGSNYGGNGAAPNNVATSGRANSGGGGGGSCGSGGNCNSGLGLPPAAGGSGIVIIRY